MMLSEFNEATGAKMLPSQYEVVEKVYNYHPIFENLEEGALPCEIKTPKDFAYLLYNIGGLQIFQDLEIVADSMKSLSIMARDVKDPVVKKNIQDAINWHYMRYE